MESQVPCPDGAQAMPATTDPPATAESTTQPGPLSEGSAEQGTAACCDPAEGAVDVEWGTGEEAAATLEQEEDVELTSRFVAIHTAPTSPRGSLTVSPDVVSSKPFSSERRVSLPSERGRTLSGWYGDVTAELERDRAASVGGQPISTVDLDQPVPSIRIYTEAREKFVETDDAEIPDDASVEPTGRPQSLAERWWNEDGGPSTISDLAEMLPAVVEQQVAEQFSNQSRDLQQLLDKVQVHKSQMEQLLRDADARQAPDTAAEPSRRGSAPVAGEAAPHAVAELRAALEAQAGEQHDVLRDLVASVSRETAQLDARLAALETRGCSGGTGDAVPSRAADRGNNSRGGLSGGGRAESSVRGGGFVADLMTLFSSHCCRAPTDLDAPLVPTEKVLSAPGHPATVELFSPPLDPQAAGACDRAAEQLVEAGGDLGAAQELLRKQLLHEADLRLQQEQEVRELRGKVSALEQQLREALDKQVRSEQEILSKIAALQVQSTADPGCAA